MSVPTLMTCFRTVSPQQVKSKLTEKIGWMICVQFVYNTESHKEEHNTPLSPRTQRLLSSYTAPSCPQPSCSPQEGLWTVRKVHTRLVVVPGYGTTDTPSPKHLTLHHRGPVQKCLYPVIMFTSTMTCDTKGQAHSLKRLNRPQNQSLWQECRRVRTRNLKKSE